MRLVRTALWVLASLIFFILSCCAPEHHNNDLLLTDPLESYAKGFRLQLTTQDTVLYLNTIPRLKLFYGKKFRSEEGLSDTVLSFSTPPKRIVCLSTTQVAFLQALGLEERIVGVAGARFLYSSRMLTAVSQGKILDVGQLPDLNVEALIALKPDLVIGYSDSEYLPEYYRRLLNFHIPVLLCNEYLESHPLGRAEWIKCLGYLMGRYPLAKSIFDSIQSSYHHYRMHDSVPRPSVLLNLPWKDIWYIPGDSTYVSQLLRDAGASNLLGEKFKDARSHALSQEEVWGAAKQAEFWLHPGQARSLKELWRYRHWKPFEKVQVYNNTRRSSVENGNDFYESGVLLPHILLRDLRQIFHPLLLDTLYPSYFYERLEAEK